MRHVILWATVAVCLTVVAWAYRQEAEVQRGQKAFQQAGCPSCHLSGGAPNLQNVGKRFSRQKLVRFIADPETIYRERGMQSLNAGYPRMPSVKTDERDIEAIATYLMTLKN